MNHFKRMQAIIDYIEDHLDETFDLNEISVISGYSIPHIYRMFGAMVGDSIMSYVRKRRLSNAMYELVSTNKSITELAFSYGYESHEAFTRTFKLTYGAPPSRYRKSKAEPILFERVNLLAQRMNKKEEMMKPEIICKDGITLIGIKRKISGPEAKKMQMLQATRDELIKTESKISNKIGDNIYYAAYDYLVEDLEKEDDDLDYTYYYCVEVSKDEQVPEGMVKKAIPQGKYAVFTYDVKNKTLNNEPYDGEIYDYIDGVWLPNSTFELTEDSDYEIVDKNRQVIDYYISIK